MAEFNKVSLGFAEFVSQLLHETFDAVLSAQNYQMEKYSELEKALSISEVVFKELYISDEELLAKEIELFGTSITENMIVNENLLKSIISNFPDFNESNGIVKGKLVLTGKEEIKNNLALILVTEKRDKIREMINKSDMVRLMVDSGEIRAKLELTNIYQDNEAKTDDSKSPAETGSIGKTKILKKPIITKSANLDFKNIGDLKSSGLKVNIFEDEVTKQKTVLIDKSSIQKSEIKPSTLPNVRLIATPAQITSNSNLFSEVVIKFKTI